LLSSEAKVDNQKSVKPNTLEKLVFLSSNGMRTSWKRQWVFINAILQSCLEANINMALISTAPGSSLAVVSVVGLRGIDGRDQLD
jgi:hypothetical protein